MKKLKHSPLKRNHFLILSLLLALILGVVACKKNKDTQSNLEAITFEFKDTNKKLWYSLDSLERLKNYSSALDLAREIKAKALDENHIPDIINSTQKELIFISTLQEESDQKSIAILDDLIAASVFPTKQLVHALKADFIKKYLDQNYYLVSNRTEISGENKSELEFWNLEQFDEEIKNNYYLSLTESEKLKRIDIREFKSLVSFKDEELDRRPTLYDLLVFDVISYLRNTRYSIDVKPNDFVWENRSLIGSNEEFLKVNLADTDTSSNQMRALQLIQELTSFHIQRKHKIASGDLSLYRLEMVLNQSHFVDSYKVFDEAYKNLAAEFEGSYIESDIVYTWMSYLMDHEDPNASDYNPNLLKEIVAKCNEFSDKYDIYTGGKNCANLAGKIKHRTLSFKTEDILLPNAVSPLRIDLKNIGKLFYKIIALDDDIFLNERLYNSKFVEELSQKSPLKTWEKAIDYTADHRQHSFIDEIPPLEIGAYLLMVCDNDKFDWKYYLSVTKSILLAKMGILVSILSLILILPK